MPGLQVVPQKAWAWTSAVSAVSVVSAVRVWMVEKVAKAAVAAAAEAEAVAVMGLKARSQAWTRARMPTGVSAQTTPRT